VGQLADKDAKTRAEAARALEEVGPPALKALDEIASHPDAGLRERAHEIRDRIAVADALLPRRFSLKCKDATVAEACRALTEQSGMQVVYAPKPDPDRAPPKTISLELDNVTFLEALDRLCQSAGLRIGFFGTPPWWRLTDGKPDPAAMIAYAGPLRLRASRIELLRTIDFQEKPVPSELLRLYLWMEGSANPAVLGWARPRAAEARDDTGRSLVLDLSAPAGTFNPIGAVTSASILLQPPAERGGTLKHLKIVIPVELMVRPQELGMVPSIVKAGGKAFWGEGGFRCKVLSAQRYGTNSLDVQLAILARENQSLDLRDVALRLSDDKGGEQVWFNSLTNPPLLTIREAEPEDLLWWSGAAQDSFPSPLPGAALALGTKLNRRQITVTARFTLPQALSGSAKLTLFRFERLRTELPFEFHDLPLP
jgi:hypothetical protein